MNKKGSLFEGAVSRRLTEGVRFTESFSLGFSLRHRLRRCHLPLRGRLLGLHPSKAPSERGLPAKPGGGESKLQPCFVLRTKGPLVKGRLPLSGGRFPLSGGNGRRPKGVGRCRAATEGVGTLPAKLGGGEFIHPVPPAAPPRAGAEAGPYTGPSHMAELPHLLHVCIHIMEIKNWCAQTALSCRRDGRWPEWFRIDSGKGKILTKFFDLPGWYFRGKLGIMVQLL